MKTAPWPQRTYREGPPGELIAEASARSPLIPGLLDPVQVVRFLARRGIACMITGWAASGALVGKPSTFWLAEILTTRPRLVARFWAQRAKSWRVSPLKGLPSIQVDRYPSRLEILGASTPLLRKIWALRQLASVNGDDIAIPTVEACLVLRAWAMRQPDRDLLDKYMDAHDVCLLTERFPSMDADVLCDLWGSAHARRGSEILTIIAEARAGRLRV